MGNELIVPVICGAVIIDKAEALGDTVMSNLERRHVIRIAFSRLSDMQELGICQILSKMAASANIKETYAKSIAIKHPDGTIDQYSFQMPLRQIATKDKHGDKLSITADGVNGYVVKASKAFWKKAALADMKFKESTEENAIRNFMDDILTVFNAKIPDGTVPTVENAEKISWWSRFWHTTLYVFAILIVMILICVAIWAFIVFCWPIIAAAFITTVIVTTTAIVVPSAATILTSIGVMIGSSALISIPAGAIITTCTKER